jgi:hypothetical protein
MAQTAQISGGAMIVWAIILAIILIFIPGLVILFAWISVVVLLLGGISTMLWKSDIM